MTMGASGLCQRRDPEGDRARRVTLRVCVCVKRPGIQEGPAGSAVTSKRLPEESCQEAGIDSRISGTLACHGSGGEGCW